MYAQVEVYMYKPESWCKLRGGCILVQITPLQDFDAGMGGGAFTPRWAYTPNISNYSTATDVLYISVTDIFFLLLHEHIP